jgi:type IV secretion system protein TrbL
LIAPAEDLGGRYQAARAAQAVGGGGPAPNTAPTAEAPPAWAQRMRHEQTLGHGVSAATRAIGDGDSGGPGASIDLSEGS